MQIMGYWIFYHLTGADWNACWKNRGKRERVGVLINRPKYRLTILVRIRRFSDRESNLGLADYQSNALPISTIRIYIVLHANYLSILSRTDTLYGIPLRTRMYSLNRNFIFKNAPGVVACDFDCLPCTKGSCK